jgi:hypothetical protein
VKPETIKIDDQEYIRADSIAKSTNEIRIVILQRGWVAVGRYSKNGSECKLENAKIIRIWGTTKGLGEIAIGGPTSKTVLDPTPTIRFHELTVINTIDCVGEKWNNIL